MQNTVKIPNFLYEIHGKKSNWIDIALPYLFGLICIGAITIMIENMGLSLEKKWTIIAIALDLGMGSISNFTYSTKKYYRNRKCRILYLCLHIIHPICMIWLFPEYTLEIAISTGAILFVAFIIDAIHHTRKQITLGVFLSLLSILAIQISPAHVSLPVLSLLSLYVIKLPLSFSINWHQLEQRQPIQ